MTGAEWGSCGSTFDDPAEAVGLVWVLAEVEALLDGLEPYLPLDPNRPRPYRVLIHTRLPESNISPFLVHLTEKCKPLAIKVGSYPKWNNGVDVSLIGNDWPALQQLIPDVENAVQGKLIESGQLGKTRSATEHQNQQQHKI